MRAKTRTRSISCGEEMSFVPGDYPCVRRFRDRRLVAYLFLQGYQITYRSMLHQTVDFFSAEHLEHLVSQGRWAEALRYVSPRFLWVDHASSSRPQSVEARVLYYFLRINFTVSQIVSGAKEGPALEARLIPCLRSEKSTQPVTDRLHSILCTLLYSQRVRDSLDWGRVRSRSAVIVRDLVNDTPELKERLLLPDGSMGPQNVPPIGFGFAPFRRTRHLKKRARQPEASAITKLYLDKRRSLPSGQCSSQNTVLSFNESDAKVFGWVADLLEECFEASKFPELCHGCPLQYTAKEVSLVLSQTMCGCGNVRNPPRNSQTTSVIDPGPAAAGNVIDPKDSQLPSFTGTGQLVENFLM